MLFHLLQLLGWVEHEQETACFFLRRTITEHFGLDATPATRRRWTNSLFEKKSNLLNPTRRCRFETRVTSVWHEFHIISSTGTPAPMSRQDSPAPRSLVWMQIRHCGAQIGIIVAPRTTAPTPNRFVSSLVDHGSAHTRYNHRHNCGNIGHSDLIDAETKRTSSVNQVTSAGFPAVGDACPLWVTASYCL